MTTATVKKTKKISFMEEIKNLKFKGQILSVFEDLNIIEEDNWIHPSVPITAFIYMKTGHPHFIFKEPNFLGVTDTERFTLNREQIAELAIEQSLKYEHLSEYETYLTLLKAFLFYRFDELKMGMQRISEILIDKNKHYGNAVLKPLRCFSSKLSVSEVIKSRLDEKINRLINLQSDTEDTYTDIIGYLVFLCISLKEKE